MNLWRKVEAKIKPWMLVLAFLVLVLFGFYREAKAEVKVELGPTLLSGDFSKSAAAVFNERFGNYVLGMIEYDGGVVACGDFTTALRQLKSRQTLSVASFRVSSSR